MRKIIQVTILLTLILGCGQGVTFDEPQPVETKSLSSFPNKIRGNYLSSDQPLILTISEKMIFKTFDYDIKVHKDSLDLDTSYYLKADTIIDKHSGEKMKVNLLGDTLIVHVHDIDTSFAISDTNVLKKFKGYYFLNIRQDNNTWSVQKLSLTRGALTFGNISAITDINHLKEFTETTADTTSYNFKLTKKQFKSFIKEDGFADEETFTRMAKNDR